MTAIATILILAVVVEAITEIFGRLGVWAQRVPTQSVSIVLGVGISIIYGADLLLALGICTRVPVVGSVITGVLISRGSNYIHDLTARLAGIRRGVSDTGTGDQAMGYDLTGTES